MKDRSLARLFLTLVLSISLVFSLTFTSVALTDSALTDGVDVIVTFKQSPGLSDQNAFQALGGQVKHSFSVIPALAGRVPVQALDGLRKNPRVASFELDRVVQALDYVATEELLNSWGVNKIGAGQVHLDGIAGQYEDPVEPDTTKKIKVAILDSGVDYTHQELADNFDPENRGYDFVQDDADPMDVYGHGTHVAGTVAALKDGYGVVGVAPEAQIFALRILDDNGYGTTTRTLAALDWIYHYNEANPADPIRITNNSYGGPTYSEAERQAFENVATSGIGVLHLAAAGNSGKKSISVDNVSCPAKYESVVAVAATDVADARASFSSTGPAVELAAPGVSVLSSWMFDTSYLNPQPFAFPDDDDYYKEGSGTSMASPHAAGTAALVWAANPGLSVQEVRDILQNTALDLGASGRDTAYGFGRIQADAAVEAALKANGVPPPDPVSIAAMIDSSVFINAATWQATVEVTISPATPGAVITGTWSNGTTTTAITDGSGMCSHQVTVSKKLNSITFNIKNVELTDYTYEPSVADTITISKP